VRNVHGTGEVECGDDADGTERVPNLHARNVNAAAARAADVKGGMRDVQRVICDV